MLSFTVMDTLSRRTLYIIGGVVVLILIVCLGIYFYSSVAQKQVVSFALPKNYNLIVTSTTASFQNAKTINLATGKLSTVTVAGAGESQVIDEVKIASSTVTYYLLSQPGAQISNIYKLDSAQPKLGLQQITFSPTSKYDLSVDPLTGSAAYLVTATSSHQAQVVAYSSATKKETTLGAGSNPVFLKGGNLVLVNRGGDLVSVNASTGTSYTVFAIATSTPYAVDNVQNEIAYYTPLTHSILFFSITNQVSASYLHAVKVPSVPVALFFGNGDLYQLVSATANKKTALQMSLVSSSSTPYAVIPAFSYVPGATKLSLQHD